MRGIEQSVAQIIQEIRRNLTDRYRSAASILREIIQNADDAGARELEFGWAPPLPTARHPLLRTCPGLWALNNAPFEALHACALHQLGLSNKPDDRVSIGRFGLGLKSVFRLCEAFFYLSSGHLSFDRQTARNRYSPEGFLNPWSTQGEDEIHREWEVEGDFQLLSQYLTAARSRFSDWFLLWIPLRTHGSHGDARPIYEWYVDDANRPPEDVFERDIEIALGQLLPMLRSVSAIRGWLGDGRGVRNQAFEAALLESSSRRAYPDIDVGADRMLGGAATCRSSGARTIRFGGVERLIDDSAFAELRQSPEWPQSGVVVEPGRFEQRPEKGDPHCAVLITELPPRDDRHGVLRVQPTVFLPVGEPTEQVECPGDAVFVLALHGYFFVDAGRRRIDLPEGDSPAQSGNRAPIRHRWNRLLRDEGVYRLVLPALAKFAAMEPSSEPRQSQEKIERLTAAVAKTTFFNENHAAICQEAQWILRVGPHGDEWQLIGGDDPYYEIPAVPPQTPTLPFEVFPALRELCGEMHVTGARTARLVRGSPRPWSEALQHRLLSGVRSRGWRIERHLDYLVQTIGSQGVTVAPDAVATRVVGIAQDVFAGVGLPAVQGAARQMRDLVRLLPPAATAVVDLGRVSQEVGDLLMRRLWGGKLRVLVVPADVLGGTDRESRAMSIDDAATALEALAGIDPGSQQTARFHDGRASIVAQFVSMVAHAERERLWERCRDLRLFPVRDYSRPRPERAALLSFEELEALRKRRTLFQLLPTNLAEPLQRALAGERVVLVEPDVARRLFGDAGVPACQDRGCIDALAASPRLATPRQRADLLRTLAGPVLGRMPTAAERQTLRYLVHGEDREILTEAPLYVGRSDAWGKLARLALEAMSGGWRLVSSELTGVLGDEDRRRLGVDGITASTTVALVRAAARMNLDCTTLTEEERVEIVREWPDTDLDVLGSLAIHENTSGRLVAIDARSYWQGDQSLEGAFEGRITLLRLSKDPMAAAKQRRLANTLTPAAALDEILGEAHAERRTRLVLELVQRIGRIPQAARERLATVRWLTGKGGEPVSPSVVIRLEGADEQIRRALQEAGGKDTQRCVPWLAIAEQLREHRGMDLISELFPAQREALQGLASVLSSSERFRIGPLDVGTVDLTTWVEAFRSASGNLLPVWPLVERLVALIGGPTVKDAVLDRLAGAIEWDRLAACVNHLSALHEGALAEERARLLALHDQYLKAIVDQDATRTRTLLGEIGLLSAAGRWRNARELVPPLDNLDPDWVLTGSQATILASVIPRGEGQKPGVVTWPSGYLPVAPDELGQALSADVTRLQVLCTEWEERGADRTSIGAIVALLGGHPAIEQLANTYGSPQTVEGLRGRLPWTPFAAPRAGAGESAVERMAKQRFKIATTSGGTVRTANLLGEPIEAPLRQDVIHLAVRSLTFFNVGSYYVSEIWFRPVPASGGQEVRSLDELLRETARWLLVHVYDQPDGSGFDQWWPKAGSEQLAIEVAQNLILNSLVFYLRQLGLRAEADLQRLIEDWEHAQRNRAQAQVAARQGTPLQGTLDDAERREHGVREGLRQVLEGAGRAPAEVLAAVRQKIRQYEYKLESIPFELFQNADDAYVERTQMHAGGGTEQPCRFVVRVDTDALRFAHWGRPVNQYRVRGSEEWTARGFDRDLEKMLVLQMSDKGVGEQHAGTTGKFGLGFKSTLLLSASPRVVSGRIGFEVVGGVFPRRLPEDDDRRLRHELRTLGEEPGGTLIELPLERAEEMVGVREAVDRFIGLAPLLVVFARAIRSCRIELPGGVVASSAWTERPVGGLRQVAVGQVSALGGLSAAPATVAVVRTQTGALLLKIGEHGFETLPAEVPTVWVTAPTSECLGFGFALNGSFDVDVGRMQLARSSSRNLEMADSMGEQVGGVLCEMFDRASDDWEALRDALGLSIDATPLSLWSSVWFLLGAPLAAGNGPAAELLRHLLWGAADHGMARLVTTRPALPTGLAVGEYGALTRLDRVRWVAVGALANDRVLTVVARWPEFPQRWPPGSIIAAEQRHDLRRLLLRCPTFHDLRLVDVLAGEVPGARLSPAVTDRLGEIVTSDFLERLGTEGEAGSRESQEIRGWLAELLFQALDGSWQPAARLLIGHDEHSDSRDEALRTRFAPADRVLACEYGERAVEFVRSARRMQAGAEELAAWALRADSEERRLAVLEYLLRGGLSRALGERLRPAVRGTWLEELTENAPLLSGFSPSDQAVIRGQLGLFSVLPIPPRPAPPASAAEVLTRLCNWWEANGPSLIVEYEREVYPGGRVPTWVNSDLRTDVHARRNWMILFMLGMTHTMGRSTAAQHREFVQRCQDQRWLEVFAEPAGQDAESWVRVLEEYLTDNVQDIEYFAWMRQFVAIFQCARWLHHYAQAFWDAGIASAPFRLADVTEPRASTTYQGTEIDAPPMSKTLGTGACFVMRELSRTRRIDNEHVSRHCYTPVARVRLLLRQIGWNGPVEEAQSGRDRATLSGSIYDFLVEHLGRDRARFGYAFDIPLLAITRVRHRDELISILDRDAAFDESTEEGDEEQGVW